MPQSQTVNTISIVSTLASLVDTQCSACTNNFYSEGTGQCLAWFAARSSPPRDLTNETASLTERRNFVAYLTVKL